MESELLMETTKGVACKHRGKRARVTFALHSSVRVSCSPCQFTWHAHGMYTAYIKVRHMRQGTLRQDDLGSVRSTTAVCVSAKRYVRPCQR